MTQIHVVKCPKCSKLMLAKAGQKTKTCPYCGRNASLQGAVIVAKAENASVAAEVLRKLKNEAGFTKS
jgi:RNA polymerase subunit RPABC4/transcription elongation factor Spt4